MAFLAFVHLALFLALSLSPDNSLVSSWCDHSMLASLLRLKRYRKTSVQNDLKNGRIGAAHTPLHSPYKARCERTKVKICRRTVVFIANSTVICSLGHGLHTFTAMHIDTSWWRGTLVKRRSLTGKLSLSCARPAADW